MMEQHFIATGGSQPLARETAGVETTTDATIRIADSAVGQCENGTGLKLLDSTWDDFYACASMAEHYLGLVRGFAEARDVEGMKYGLKRAGANFRFIAGSLKEIEAQFAQVQEAA